MARASLRRKAPGKDANALRRATRERGRGPGPPLRFFTGEDLGRALRRLAPHSAVEMLNGTITRTLADRP